MVKTPPSNVEDVRHVDLIVGSGRSPGGGTWQPIPVFLSGKFNGQRRLACCSPWGCKELDMTEQMNMHVQYYLYGGQRHFLLLQNWGICKQIHSWRNSYDLSQFLAVMTFKVQVKDT